ncbi:polysaccharide pyruvyl transferase family protein [Sporomusa sp. GT1]|uniref:polysaccharide pyruvyl transferase family protein n=1 Tax=Sporomusa sp. GT1 TaxID=1534747 RepID=UPI0016657284|nr:polysaccharide pyruvyl transferase family protein [Sporomusa sp. GT1]
MNDVLESKTIILFGLGNNFFSYFNRLSSIIKIEYLCDNNKKNLDIFSRMKIYPCISPRGLQALRDPFVIITSGTEEAISSIRNQMSELDIPCCHAEEALAERDSYQLLNKLPGEWLHKYNRKFVDISLDGTMACNFRCEYCYLKDRALAYSGQVNTSLHTPQKVRKGLSQKRLGGKCFINICARGETLLSEDIVELVYELLSEGHVVSIVTNGTISEKFNQFLTFPSQLQKNLFIKFSFHYMELLKHSLLEVFFDNVNKIKSSCSSYTIEITPCDSMVPHIEDIKLIFEKYANGAMPHISFARDSSKESLAVLTSLSLDEYNRVWGQFHSKMFELKSLWYDKKIEDFCYAGDWSCRINLMEGSIQSCYHHKSMGNLFRDMDKPFPIQLVGTNCQMPYCFNDHAYLAFGCVPSIDCYSYLDMRDRVDKDGNHWVKPELGSFIKAKLYDNNHQYDDQYKFLDGFFSLDRNPAFIVLNSPDYPNIGDHAIALAERSLLEGLNCSREIYEITSTYYKNSNVREYIKKEDVLLFTGGGYLGSLWINLEDTVRLAIDNHPDNAIIILPQSLFFENSAFGRRECQLSQEIYNRHKRLYMCLRDPFSYQLANRIFDDHIGKMFLPDAALLLNYSEEEFLRTGALLCLREDRESTIAKESRDLIHRELQKRFTDVGIISNIVSEPSSMTKREEAVDRFIRRIKTAEVVVTDRLHTMIFCVISRTPCLVLDNISNKVFGVYGWIKHLDYISKLDNPFEIEQKLNGVINSNSRFDSERYDMEFEQLRKLLRELA